MLLRKRDCTPSGIIIATMVIMILGMVLWGLLKG